MPLSLCNTTTNLHQKELLQHGNAAFPIACYEESSDTIYVPWHWHDEWEFILVEKGILAISLENAQFTLSAGSGLFINSCALHSVNSQHTNTAVLRSAVFHPRLIGGSIDSTFWHHLVLPLLNDNAPKYLVLDPQNPLHKQMLADFRKAWESVVYERDDYENLTRYLLSRMWRSLCEHCIQKNTVLSAQDRVDAERIRTMLTYIDANYANKLDIKKIADSVNISESVCLRCFHRMIGITPMQYVKKIRLDKAAELLRSSSMTAKAVALECGFNDISYFTKAFRERTGCTPKEYQRGEVNT